MPPVRRGMIPVRDCGPGGVWTTSKWMTFPSRIISPRWKWSAARLTAAVAASSSAPRRAKRPLPMPRTFQTHANLWRVSGDFWDNWKSLNHEFSLGARWHDFVGPGHWPDADMLPVGHLSVSNRSVGPDRFTHFTRDEQLTHLSLWSLLPSPLMIGANLADNDDWTTALLTNPEVLAVNQDACGQTGAKNNRPAANRGNLDEGSVRRLVRRRNIQPHRSAGKGGFAVAQSWLPIRAESPRLVAADRSGAAAKLYCRPATARVHVVAREVKAGLQRP